MTITKIRYSTSIFLKNILSFTAGNDQPQYKNKLFSFPLTTCDYVTPPTISQNSNNLFLSCLLKYGVILLCQNLILLQVLG